MTQGEMSWRALLLSFGLAVRWTGVPTDQAQTTMPSTSRRWQLSIERAGDDAALLRLAGSWKLEDQLPDPDEVMEQMPPGRPIRRLAFDTQEITGWDTGLLAYVAKLGEWGVGKGIETDLAGLPDGIQRLLKLATAVPRRQTGAAAGPGPPSWSPTGSR